MATQREVHDGVIATGLRLDVLARRYGWALHTFFMRRTGYHQHDCEDLTQEVFLKLARRRAQEEIRDIAPYLFHAASNVLADHYRRKASSPVDKADVYCPEADSREDFSPERVVLGREAIEHLMTIVETLPDRAREAFVLYRFEELGHGEIAGRMGISVSSVEKHVRLGMVRVAQALKAAE